MKKDRFHYASGCLKDPRDIRDLPMGLLLPEIPVPASVDYTVNMTPVKDQGNEGTCVAFACVVGMKEYQDRKEYRRYVELSPRFLYNLCKSNDGAPGEEGTYPRIAFKLLAKYGVCLESCWPYRPHQRDFPCTEGSKQALTYRINTYARLKGLPEMKRSLLVNGPFVAGVTVFSSWMGARVASDGVIPMPKSRDEELGGHAICVVGYNETQKTFKFKNSWGLSWGHNGYGYLPYDYMKLYCQDAWSATDLIEDPSVLVNVRKDIMKKYCLAGYRAKNGNC